MTIASTSNKNLYAGPAGQAVFPYTFVIWHAADLRVVRRSATGVEMPLTLNTDFTVSGVGDANGGNVTLSAPLAAGEYLLVKRVIDLVQETDLVENAATPAEVMEGAFDRLTAMVQQVAEGVDRAIVMPETTAPADSLSVEALLATINGATVQAQEYAGQAADEATDAATQKTAAAGYAGNASSEADRAKALADSINAGTNPDQLVRVRDLGTNAWLDNTWLYASATWDVASVANGAQTSTTVAIPGAGIGDYVLASCGTALSGLALRGEVTAQDVVTLYLFNSTGSAVDLASATYNVAVLKHVSTR